MAPKLNVSGEVHFKRLLWWHFFIISQLEAKRQNSKKCQQGCNKTTMVAGKPEMLPSLCKHLQQLSLNVCLCLFASILDAIIICLIINTRLSYPLLQPNFTNSVFLVVAWDNFLIKFTLLLSLLWYIFGQANRPLIFTGFSLFGLISLICIDSFHMGCLSECVYFDQWVQWVNTNVCYLSPSPASPY